MSNRKSTKQTGPATHNQLWQLHRDLALYFSARLKEATADKPVRASTLAVIRQFLNDNGIDAGSAAAMSHGLAALYGEESETLNFPFTPPERPSGGK
jgi:hypothetical protein